MQNVLMINLRIDGEIQTHTWLKPLSTACRGQKQFSKSWRRALTWTTPITMRRG